MDSHLLRQLHCLVMSTYISYAEECNGAQMSADKLPCGGIGLSER